MSIRTGLGLIALAALLVACAPAADDPRRSLSYKPPNQDVEPGFSPNEGFRPAARGGRTSSASNKFGRSRGTIRSNNRFSRRRIGR